MDVKDLIKENLLSELEKLEVDELLAVARFIDKLLAARNGRLFSLRGIMKRVRLPKLF